MSLSLHCVVNVWFFVSQCELFVNESFCFSYQRIRSAEWLTDWVNDWICDFSLRASSAMDGGHDRNKIWHKSSLGIEDNAHMSNTHIARACAEKAHDTTLDNEKCNWHDVGAVCIDRTCIVVTAQCNQPEAFCDSRWSSVRHVTWKNNLRCPIALIQRHVPGEHDINDIAPCICVFIIFFHDLKSCILCNVNDRTTWSWPNRTPLVLIRHTKSIHPWNRFKSIIPSSTDNTISQHLSFQLVVVVC